MKTKGCSVYLALPMTGYDKVEMKRLAQYAVDRAKFYGLDPYCPVMYEKIEGQGKLTNTETDLDWKWPMDKELLNNCFCFVNLRADEKSFGCEDEYGRHRYSEWQPSFKISPKHASGYKSIANYQSDGLFGDLNSCFAYIKNNYGTRQQRILFKLKIWIKSSLPWMFRQLKRLFQ